MNASTTTKIAATMIVAIALVLPSSTLAHGPGPKETVAAFHKALTDGKGDDALALLVAEASIFESGHVETRDEYAAGHLAGDMAFSATTNREILDQQVATVGDAAWVTTRSRTTGAFRDKPVDMTGAETMVLQHTKDGWRIVHVHWSAQRAN